MASTSSREIGFAAAVPAAAPAAAPADAADPEGAEAPRRRGRPGSRARRRRYICRMLGTEDGRYDASEHAHDALLPVLSLAALGTRTRALRRGRQFASTRPPHILKRDGATMQSARFISSPRPCAVRVAPRRL